MLTLPGDDTAAFGRSNNEEISTVAAVAGVLASSCTIDRVRYLRVLEGVQVVVVSRYLYQMRVSGVVLASISEACRAGHLNDATLGAGSKRLLFGTDELVQLSVIWTYGKTVLRMYFVPGAGPVVDRWVFWST